jgi:hypothetical protein
MKGAVQADEIAVRGSLHSNASGKLGRDPSFYRRIKHLADTAELLPGVKIQVEHLEKTGRGRDEVVNILFRVEREITELVDERKRTVQVASAGPRFSYTFTASRSLGANLKDLKTFYAKRCKAGEPMPPPKKAAPARA